MVPAFSSSYSFNDTFTMCLTVKGNPSLLDCTFHYKLNSEIFSYLYREVGVKEPEIDDSGDGVPWRLDGESSTAGVKHCLG